MIRRFLSNSLPCDLKSRALVVTIAAALIVGIIISWKLWVAGRIFPHAPLWDSLSPFDAPFDGVLIMALLLALSYLIFKPGRFITGFVAVLIILLAIQDQMRWQPWILVYLLIFFPYAIIPSKKPIEKGKILLRSTRLLLIGMYFWAGFHKFDPNFFEFVYPEILTDLFGITRTSTLNALSPLAVTVPLVEILVAVLLVWKKSRNAGVFLAIATHLFILIYLSPLGIDHDYIVYPWNIAMIIAVFISFFNVKEPIQLKFGKSRNLMYLVILLCWFLPALNIWHGWDNFLSFNVYSGSYQELFVAIPDSEWETYPETARKYESAVGSYQGYRFVNVARWSYGELKVPVYPETRVLNKISDGICKLGPTGTGIQFLIFTRDTPKKLIRQYKCPP